MLESEIISPYFLDLEHKGRYCLQPCMHLKGWARVKSKDAFRKSIFGCNLLQRSPFPFISWFMFPLCLVVPSFNVFFVSEAWCFAGANVHVPWLNSPVFMSTDNRKTVRWSIALIDISFATLCQFVTAEGWLWWWCFLPLLCTFWSPGHGFCQLLPAMVSWFSCRA